MRCILATMLTIGLTAAASADDLHPRVKLDTSLGEITIELDAVNAPISTTNFLNYVEDGHYNGTCFHRVMATFMIQGGGYMPDLSEKKPGHPPIFNEWRNGLKNARGTIAMARTNVPNSATAQFFINVVDNENLDKPGGGGAAYAVFGKVVEGMEAVDKIKDTKVKSDPKLPMGEVVPVEPVIIKSAKVLDGGSLAKTREAIKAADDAALKALIEKSEAEAGAKFTKSDSGLMKLVLKAGDGASPKPESGVKVHYTGWLLNGRKFDSSVDKGQPAEFPLPQMIKGWIEGVPTMKVGEKAKFVIPASLGWADKGSRDMIPPDAIVVFDVELLGVKE